MTHAQTIDVNRKFKTVPSRELVRQRYFPNLVLTSHEGRKLKFYDDMVKDKIVIFNMFYAKCEGICSPIGVAYAASSIWVVNNFSNSVTRLSTAGAVLGTYAVGRGPFGVAGEGANVWITNYFDKSVTKLRAADGFNLGTFKIGDGTAGILFDGANLWVVCNGDSTVAKVSPSSGTIVATYATGKGPFSVAFDGTSIWVPNFGSNSVSKTAAN